MKIISSLLPVIIAILLGFFFSKKKYISKEGFLSIKNVVVKITLPLLLVKAFMSNSYDITNIYVFLIIFAGCLLAFFATKLIFKNPLAPFMSSGFELGMLGYALFPLLFVQGGTAALAMIDPGQVIFVFTVYTMFALKLSGQPMKSALRSMLTNPIIYAIFIGLILGISGFINAVPEEVSELLDSVLTFISAPTGFLVLFAVGSELDFSKEVIGESLKLCLTRLLVMAVIGTITYFAISAITDDQLLIYAGVFLFTLPPPFILPMFLKDERDVKISSTAISISTLITLAAFAVFAAILG